MSESNWLLPLLMFVIGALSGATWMHFRHQKTEQDLRDERSRLDAELQSERKHQQDQSSTLQKTREQFSEAFSDLTRQALKQNNEQFLELANENFKRHSQATQSEMDKKEKAVDDLLKPIRDALEKTESQIHSIEKDRKSAYGSLEQQLKSMAESQTQLQTETRNLVQAFRRPEVRGQWGELTLKRLVELAGMVDRCDFFEQESTDTETGKLRPDMIVRLPEGREIVVDVKTPLDAYLSAVEASDDSERQHHMQRHARNVRERVRELAGKSYWSQFENSPDFVVLFIPGDQFLNAAFEIDDRLLEDALQQKVIIATPTSLVALLRAIAFGWRQMSVAENAEQIRTLGEDMYGRLCAFGEHLNKLGKSLGSSVDHYNKAVGSLDRKVLPGARKFTELGIHSSKSLPELDPLEKVTRQTDSADS